MSTRQPLSRTQAALLLLPPFLFTTGYFLFAPFNDPDKLTAWVKWLDSWPNYLLLIGAIMGWPLFVLWFVRRARRESAPTVG